MYYNYDKQAALSADSIGGRITEKGKYIGKFTRAEHIKSPKTGTVGIEFDFVTNDGLRARFNLYTRKSDGTTIYGYKQLMTLMTCLGLRGLADPQNRMARVYDIDLKREVEKTVPQFVELLDKPIGLLIHMEEYGDAGKWRPAFSHAFEASTELMATEILNEKVVPERLPKVLASLQDRPLKEGSGQSNRTKQYGNAYESAKNGNLNYANQQAALAGQYDDEDIPF